MPKAWKVEMSRSQFTGLAETAAINTERPFSRLLWNTLYAYCVQGLPEHSYHQLLCSWPLFKWFSFVWALKYISC